MNIAHPDTTASTTTATLTTIEDARLALLHDELQLTPSAFRSTLAKTLDDLTRASTGLGITRCCDLIGRVEDILLKVTGDAISAPTLEHGSAAAARLHRYRNVLCTLIVLSVESCRDVKAALEDTKVQIPRTARVERSLSDDEILLMRSYALRQTQSTDPRIARGGLIYALVEAGVDAHEISHIKVCDLQGSTHPERVHATGYGHTVTERSVPLEPFAAALAHRCRSRMPRSTAGEEQPLAYRPRKHEPGTIAAYKSVHMTLTNTLVHTGLKFVDTTPNAVGSWRHQLEYTRGRDAAVRAVCGRSDIDNLKARFLTEAQREQDFLSALDAAYHSM